MLTQNPSISASVPLKNHAVTVRSGKSAFTPGTPDGAGEITVLVVEHDADVMAIADHIVD